MNRRPGALSRAWLSFGVALSLCLSVGALAQGVTTTSTTTSHSTGPTNSTYAWSILTVGPATTITGDVGACTFQSPPYPTCVFTGGTGTIADPNFFSCSSALAVTACTLPGTPVNVLAGQRDVNTHFHVQLAGASAATAAVPLAPWVPIGSALGAALIAFLAWRSSGRRA